jgi:hypothetical protein
MRRRHRASGNDRLMIEFAGPLSQDRQRLEPDFLVTISARGFRTRSGEPTSQSTTTGPGAHDHARSPQDVIAHRRENCRPRTRDCSRSAGSYTGRCGPVGWPTASTSASCRCRCPRTPASSRRPCAASAACSWSSPGPEQGHRLHWQVPAPAAPRRPCTGGRSAGHPERPPCLLTSRASGQARARVRALALANGLPIPEHVIVMTWSLRNARAPRAS